MRAARFFFGLAVAGFLVVEGVGAPRAAAGEAPPDSSASTSTVPATADSTTSADTDSTIFTIHPVKGDSIQVRYVGPWGTDMLRYRTVTGETRYIATNKVRTIKDAKGDERKDEVITRRGHVGDPTPEERPHFGSGLLKSLRTNPDRARWGYFVTEFGFSRALGAEARGGVAGTVVQSGFGWMRNLPGDWALGGVIQLASDAEDYHFGGVGVRLCRYLSNDWSLEGTAGVFTAEYRGDGQVRGIPVFIEVGANALGAATFFTRFEQHSFSYTRFIGPWITLGDIEVSDDVLRLGIRLGPRPRVIAIPLAAVGAMVVMSGGPNESFYP